jgi:hypothetical protein
MIHRLLQTLYHWRIEHRQWKHMTGHQGWLERLKDVRSWTP